MSLLALADEIRRYCKTNKHSTAPGVLAMRTALQVVNPKMDSLSKKSIDHLEKWMPEFSGTFLDVGCYGGWVYPFVKDRVEYTGIDPWPNAIEVSKKLWGDRFHCVSYENYNTQHDIVWAAHLQPEHTLSVEGVLKLRSLARKMLVIIDTELGWIVDATECDRGWVVFRK